MYTYFSKLTILMMMVNMAMSHAKSKITFEVSFKEPQAHYAEINMTLSGIRQDYVDVKMPVWAPGSYLVREFSKHVEGFEARSSSGEIIENDKINKNTWRIKSRKADKIVIRYRIYGFEVSVRTNFIDANHAFLSPPGTFMYVDGFIAHPAEVKIIPHASWSQVSTGLEPVAGKVHTYYAENFDTLFDAPIEVGNQDIFSFEAAGVQHEVAMVGGGNYDKERLTKDITRIVEESTAIFGVNPNKRYVFIVHNYQSGGGGLEHLNSTVLGATRFSYTNEAAYKGFLGLVAHEYFHLWNVKRLRPVALGPFNYDAENYTPSLWIAEGFTAYYDNLLLRRCDLYTADKYIEVLTADFQAVENRPGNQVQSVADASFDAWIKYYRQDENSVNNSVSYYNKGALMALMVDLAIIEATRGDKSLDDVMKAMYDTYYVKEDRGFTDAEFMEMASKVAGTPLDDIYRAATSAGTPDYRKYLGYAGLELIDLNEGTERVDLGARTTITDGRIIVNQVLRGTAAWEAGINVRDELIAVDGFRLDAAGKELERLLREHKAGDQIKVLLARDGLLQEIQVTLQQDRNKRFVIMPVPTPTAMQIVVRNKWLKL